MFIKQKHLPVPAYGQLRTNIFYRLLHFLNTAVDILSALLVFIFLLIGTYALTDAFSQYNQADQTTYLAYKPDITEASSTDTRMTFEDLIAVNPDVCAWITLEDTPVDFPILQGRTNSEYINHDLYGNFALSGSIFLDSANSQAFEDSYSLVYGHHMEYNRMFGCLDQFKDETYFKNHRKGSLLTPDGVIVLTVVACLETSAYNNLFYPDDLTITAPEDILTAASKEGLFLDDTAFASKGIIALSTCQETSVDARLLVLAVFDLDAARSLHGVRSKD